MPLLPRGMFMRGSSYYMRKWSAGRDRRQSLGSDYAKAMDRFDRAKRGQQGPGSLPTLDKHLIPGSRRQSRPGAQREAFVKSPRGIDA